MTDAPKTDPFAALLTDDQPCSCGTYREALDEALREFMAQRRGDTCDGWYLTKAYAHATIASMLLSNAAMQGELHYAVRAAQAEQRFGAGDALEYLDAQLAAICAAPEVSN